MSEKSEKRRDALGLFYESVLSQTTNCANALIIRNVTMS